MSASPGNGQKAAVLMSAVGVASAAKILQHLPESMIATLTQRVATLETVAPQTAQAVLEELVEAVQGSHGPSFGGLDYAAELLDRTVDSDTATRIIERVKHSAQKRPLAFLGDIQPERVAVMLRGESAQTIALIMVSLPSSVAANVLKALPEAAQAEITFRIATLGEIDPAIVKLIDAQLQRQLVTAHQDEVSSPGGVDRLAGIMRYTPVTTERAILDHFGEHEQTLSDQLRELLFTFEDLVKLDDRSLQLVLREADRDDLVTALRGTIGELRERVYANVSERAAALLQDDLQRLPKVPRSRVEQARGRIIAKAHEMEEARLLTLPRGDEQLLQ